MRIGIVADIHDAVSPLRRALTLLRQHDVEQIVTLGDAFETYLPHEPAAEGAMPHRTHQSSGSRRA